MFNKFPFQHINLFQSSDLNEHVNSNKFYSLSPDGNIITVKGPVKFNFQIMRNINWPSIDIILICNIKELYFLPLIA